MEKALEGLGQRMTNGERDSVKYCICRKRFRMRIAERVIQRNVGWREIYRKIFSQGEKCEKHTFYAERVS